MCTTCGCGEGEIRISAPGVTAGTSGGPGGRVTVHTHVDARGRLSTHTHADSDGGAHSHEETAAHDEVVPHTTHTVLLEQQILAKNDGLAASNRSWLEFRGITAVNLMSSPGAGKTSLLERTIREVGVHRSISVIEGDQETLLDSARIQRAGARAVQVNTGAGCHLDASMVRSAIERLSPSDNSLLMVENVGNLVCPALFDLGENGKVVIISVTEGDDKPLKYPHMFTAADLVVINKTDLLPYVDFDVAACTAHARALQPDVEILTLSVKSGTGMDRWYAWLSAL